MSDLLTELQQEFTVSREQLTLKAQQLLDNLVDSNFRQDANMHYYQGYADALAIVIGDLDSCQEVPDYQTGYIKFATLFQKAHYLGLTIKCMKMVKEKLKI